VLVIDDKDALRLVSQMLRRKGFTVIAAGNGEGGLDLFRTSTLPVDVVVLDLTLPGMSSRGVLAELRRIQPGLKLIITSAYGQDWALTTLGGQHPWLYIRKPYQLSQLADLRPDACLDKP
jgi:DNA-binding NtrC family response regulator